MQDFCTCSTYMLRVSIVKCFLLRVIIFGNLWANFYEQERNLMLYLLFYIISCFKFFIVGITKQVVLRLVSLEAVNQKLQRHLLWTQLLITNAKILPCLLGKFAIDYLQKESVLKTMYPAYHPLTGEFFILVLYYLCSTKGMYYVLAYIIAPSYITFKCTQFWVFRYKENTENLGKAFLFLQNKRVKIRILFFKTVLISLYSSDLMFSAVFSTSYYRMSFTLLKCVVYLVVQVIHRNSGFRK